MTGSSERAGAGGWNYWRIAGWAGALALLLVPVVMMRISDQWHWGVGSFVFAAVLIGGVGLLCELIVRVSGSRAYRAGGAVALVASFLTVWTTLVRDDGTGMSYFMLILAAAVGGFAAWFRPSGMARTMLGVAIMQALLSIAVATAPSTANVQDGVLRALLSGGFFTMLWLASAAFFRVAAKGEHRDGSASN